MRRTVKRALLALPGFAALCRLLTRRHVRTLMYHRFTTDATANPRALDAAGLRGHLRLILRHHDVWTPADQRELLAGRRRPRRPPVVITIDDGYRDFYEVAFPVLREARVPAMLFVTTGFVDGTTWFWWDRLRVLLREGTGRRATVEVGGRPFDLDLTDAARRERCWNDVADRCRFLADADKEAALRSVAAALGVDWPDAPPARFAPITWDEARAMAAAGILFGAHTVTHPILSRVPPEQARAEIANSRRRLEAELGAPVEVFCYPQGGPADYTPAVRALVAEAGFAMAYVAYQRPDRPEDPFLLPRYCPPPDPLALRWALCGAEFLAARVRVLLGRGFDPGEAYWAGSD